MSFPHTFPNKDAERNFLCKKWVVADIGQTPKDYRKDCGRRTEGLLLEGPRKTNPCLGMLMCALF